MAINPAAVGTSAYELLDGSVSSFYAEVDEAIAASEVVKGQYRMTINPAYNSPNPVDSNSFTTVGLTQSGPMVVDLENSYITTDVELTITPNQDMYCPEAEHEYYVFFGWKRSIEAVERYDILVNSTPIYTQSFCGEESFIMGQVENDMVRKKSPFITSTYQNILNFEPGCCGTYVKFTERGEIKADTPMYTSSSGFKLLIPIKIPVANFPILKNMKYLLSWMGKWEIRLYFSPQNMIVVPIDPWHASAVKNGFNFISHLDKIKTIDGFYTSAYGIHQIGQNIPMYCKQSEHTGTTKIPTVDKVTHGDATLAHDFKFLVQKMTMRDVSMNTAQFQIRMDVLEMLKQKYMMEKPLTFPVSTFQIARFTGPPCTSGPYKTVADNPLSIVLCQAINNCDTMFILPFNEACQHTVCRNPEVKALQLHAGEYGSYPTQPFDTLWQYGNVNIRFVNAAMDALNVNGSELTSFNEDVITSFVPSPMIVNAGGTAEPDGHLMNIFQTALRDQSNFFIPFPFSTDDDFQGGMSSPSSNINFKLTGTWATSDLVMETPWVAVFLIDGVVMIRPDPGSDAAKVIWSDRTVC